MIKDPLDHRETAYDLLGLGPDATPTDVNRALPRFMRNPRNLPNLGRAQEAMRRLRDPKDRAGLDVWFYPLQMPVIDDGPDLELDDLRQVPVASPRDLYTDFTPEAASADGRAFRFKVVSISELRRYDGLDHLRLEPPFDR